MDGKSENGSVTVEDLVLYLISFMSEDGWQCRVTDENVLSVALGDNAFIITASEDESK